jgi:hypothetical protein
MKAPNRPQKKVEQTRAVQRTHKPQRQLPLPQDPIHLLNLGGFIQTVTSIPTAAPKSFYEQVKIYMDDLASPTTRRLYIYSQEADDWLYVALST